MPIGFQNNGIKTLLLFKLIFSQLRRRGKKYLRVGPGTGMSRDLFNIVPSAFLTSVLDKGNEGCNLCLLRMLTKVVVRLFVPPHMSCSITFDMGPILHFDS